MNNGDRVRIYTNQGPVLEATVRELPESFLYIQVSDVKMFNDRMEPVQTISDRLVTLPMQSIFMIEEGKLEEVPDTYPVCHAASIAADEPVADLEPDIPIVPVAAQTLTDEDPNDLLIHMESHDCN